jgi:DNA-binding winged helix-turn-helix (wHTH) protein/tetratricopeptide (TPR) repeat protein
LISAIFDAISDFRLSRVNLSATREPYWKLEAAVAETEAKPTVYHFDQFRLDIAGGTLHGPDGAILEIRPKAFALLRFLVQNPGRLHGRAELLETLWPNVVVTDDSLTQCVSDLRQAFGTRASHVLKTLPRRGYVLTAEVRGESVTRPMAAAPVAASTHTALLIVEPFEHFGGGVAADVASALTTELLTELTRFEGVSVFSAPHGATAGSFRIRGEVRLAGQYLHIAGRLEDAATGAALWAERVERPCGPSLPAGVVEMLAAVLVRQADREDLRRARQKSQSELTVRELCLIGRDHHHRGTEADTFVALSMFDQAIAVDPDFALPHAWQAYTVHRVITHGWGPPIGDQAARERALSHARRAVQLEPDSPLCLSRLAFILMLHQRWDEAVDTARVALRTGRPADYVSRNTCSEVLAHGNYPAEAAEAVQRALSLDPHCPPTTRSLLGRALLMNGQPEAALPELRWCAARLPDYIPCFHSLIVAAVETGRLEEAQAALREAVRLQPHWVPSNHTGNWFFRRERDAERFMAAFRAAGWAETSGRSVDGRGGRGRSGGSTDPVKAGLASPATRSAADLRATKPLGNA